MMDIEPYNLALILLALPDRFGRRAIRAQSEIPAGLVIGAMLEQGLITELDVGIYARVPAKMPRLMAWAPEAWVIRTDVDDWRRAACIDLVSKTFAQSELDTAAATEECFGIIGVSREDRVIGCAMLAAAGDIVSLQGFDIRLGASEVPSTALVNLAVDKPHQRRGLGVALVEWAWQVTLAAKGRRMFAGSETVCGQRTLLKAGMRVVGQFDTENLRWRVANDLYGNRLADKTQLYRFDKDDGAPTPPWEPK